MTSQMLLFLIDYFPPALISQLAGSLKVYQILNIKLLKVSVIFLCLLSLSVCYKTDISQNNG